MKTRGVVSLNIEFCYVFMPANSTDNTRDSPNPNSERGRRSTREIVRKDESHEQCMHREKNDGPCHEKNHYWSVVRTKIQVGVISRDSLEGRRRCCCGQGSYQKASFYLRTPITFSAPSLKKDSHQSNQNEKQQTKDRSIQELSYLISEFS